MRRTRVAHKVRGRDSITVDGVIGDIVLGHSDDDDASVCID